MKKWQAFVTVSVSMMLISGISHAGGPDADAPKGKIIVSGEYGFFQQSNAATQYGILANRGLTLLNPQGEIIRVPTQYHFGWGSHIGYLFPNNYDILLSNFIFYGSDNGVISPGSGQTVFMTAAPGSLAASAGKTFSVYDYRAELYQLALGYNFHFLHNHFLIHPFFGAGLGKAWESQQINYNEVSTVNGNNGILSLISSFNGIGPAVGMDLSWNIWRWFNFVGNVTWTAVIAKIKQNYLASLANNAAAYDVYGTSNPEVINILTFEAGLSSTFQIKQEEMAIMFGYRATNIMNASSDLLLGQGTANVFGDFVVDSFKDYSFQGPFIRVSAAINT